MATIVTIIANRVQGPLHINERNEVGDERTSGTCLEGGNRNMRSVTRGASLYLEIKRCPVLHVTVEYGQK